MWFAELVMTQCHLLSTVTVTDNVFQYFDVIAVYHNSILSKHIVKVN